MATFGFSEIIELVPVSKLTFSTAVTGESGFNLELIPAGMAEPLEFPPLDQAILQEDTICVPVEPGIPQEEEITAHVVKSVCSHGINQDQVTVLLPEGTSPDCVDRYRQELESAGCGSSHVEVHHAAEKSELGYLGPSQSGEPIVLNARLVHADFVLPVSRAKPFGWKSQVEFLYPYFSDVESQKRFFNLDRSSRIALNQEVHRWLGDCFLVSVATRFQQDSSGEVVGTAFIGEHDSVNQKVQDYFQQVYSSVASNEQEEVEHDLVVANLQPNLCLSVEELNGFVDDLKAICKPGGSIVMLWDDQSSIPFLVDAEKGYENGDLVAGISDEQGRSVFLITDQDLLKQIGYPPISNLSEMENLVKNHQSILGLPDFINDFQYHKNRS